MSTFKTTQRWAGAVALVAALATPSAWAHGAKSWASGMDMAPMAGLPMMEDSVHRERMLERMDALLDLQPEQREQIRALSERTAKAMQPLYEEQLQLRDEQRKLWQAPQLDEAAIAALRERSLRLHERMVTQREQAMLEMARILTPEQRQRLSLARDKHGHHAYGGPGRRY